MTLADLILDDIHDSPADALTIAYSIHQPAGSIRSALSLLKQQGLVESVPLPRVGQSSGVTQCLWRLTRTKRRCV